MYWLWDPDDIMAAIYYNEQDQPDGYVIYWIANEVLHIKDMIFNNETARWGCGTRLGPLLHDHPGGGEHLHR